MPLFLENGHEIYGIDINPVSSFPEISSCTHYSTDITDVIMPSVSDIEILANCAGL